ncbi:DUF4352 domain-containing protein [Streptococcus suis]|uniref:DUF4352 domain-containing protein n=1 Tax=Streptococcus suis TaxID=1307 RepID=A0A4T2GPN6_STRSU|nr:DUF4352 domain-containing protein [Streptococcus suis]MBM7269920.1 DUF4352 domain-containing protein [Streptococcus suis]MBM7314675.1 DUF4352 domain-containing protein [Streptococcus suis]TIH99810.1 DUF4352 domain-containing protein [Streptococcus suis]
MNPKEFVVEDGLVYYRKKPLHKQVLFWTTLVGGLLSFILTIICILLSLGLTAEKSYSSLYDSSTYSDYYYEDTSSLETISLGESREVQSGLEMVVTRMEKDSSLELVDTYYTNAFVVEVEMTNTSDQVYYFDEYAFSLVDAGTDMTFLLDYATYDVNIPEKIDPGQSLKVKLVYGVDGESSFYFVYDSFAWTQVVGQGI